MMERVADRVIQNFQRTWNHHDADGFANCFREDGDFVNVVGQRVAGRPAISAMHQHGFDTIQKDATTSVERLELRKIGPRFVAADLWWKVVGSRSREGEPLPERHGFAFFVIEVNNEVGLIVSGRNSDLTQVYGRVALR